MAASGRAILSRSSFRYLFFFVFLFLSAAFYLLARFIQLGYITLPFLNVLSQYALSLIFVSASFIILMNRGSPKKIVLDGDGIILIHPGKNLRLWKEEIAGIRVVETISLPPDLDKRKKLSTKKIEIELACGTAIPIYEGANEGRIEKIATGCRSAIESGPSDRARDSKGKPENGLFKIKLGAHGIIRKEDGTVSIRPPIKIDIPGFLMGCGMLCGFGIFLFGSPPGQIERTALVISIVIWVLVALSLVFAFIFTLFGKQKLVIGEKEIASRRRFLGIPFPAQTLKRSEAASVLLDLEAGRLSIISKEMKRITAESPDRVPMGEKMGELLGGKAVKLDLSSLVWSERIAIQKEIADILSAAGAMTSPRAG
jgi:hypothetical protein